MKPCLLAARRGYAAAARAQLVVVPLVVMSPVDVPLVVESLVVVPLVVVSLVVPLVVVSPVVVVPLVVVSIDVSDVPVVSVVPMVGLSVVGVPVEVPVNIGGGMISHAATGIAT